MQERYTYVLISYLAVHVGPYMYRSSINQCPNQWFKCNGVSFLFSIIWLEHKGLLFVTEARNQVMEATERLGGQYSGSLHPKCTHLVVQISFSLFIINTYNVQYCLSLSCFSDCFTISLFWHARHFSIAIPFFLGCSLLTAYLARLPNYEPRLPMRCIYLTSTQLWWKEVWPCN